VSRLGLHLRLQDSIQEVIDQALRLQLPFFQCFLTGKSGSLVQMGPQEINYFADKVRQHFSTVYLHGSYLSNLCRPRYSMHPVLEIELAYAKQLAFTHLILHPGSSRGCESNEEGINWLARALNKVLKREHDIKIVLENTAHGSFSVGGDLHDFRNLLAKLNHPEKISFCIDTAHAYSFGYDLAVDTQQDEFIDLIDATITRERVALIHLNDTQDALGSFVDRHCVAGEGNIGEYPLRRFIKQPAFAEVPIIMELPVLADEEVARVYQKVKHWL